LRLLSDRRRAGWCCGGRRSTLEIDEYLELARYRGVNIEHVLETHNHADHVSGHGRLVAATGARIHVHRLAGPVYDHEPFEDGWELQLGSLVVRAAHTRPRTVQSTQLFC
jgi:hydroxyacylglutathione hydrolase